MGSIYNQYVDYIPYCISLQVENGNLMNNYVDKGKISGAV